MKFILFRQTKNIWASSQRCQFQAPFYNSVILTNTSWQRHVKPWALPDCEVRKWLYVSCMFIVKCANSYEAQTKADGPTGAACVKSHTIHLSRLCSYPASGVHTAANEMNCGGCLDSVRSGANRGTAHRWLRWLCCRLWNRVLLIEARVSFFLYHIRLFVHLYIHILQSWSLCLRCNTCKTLSIPPLSIFSFFLAHSLSWSPKKSK